MKIPRFTFVIPNSAWFGKRYWHQFPYTMALLAACLKEAGFEVHVIDANINRMDEVELAAEIAALAPVVVGVSAMTLEYGRSVHRTMEIVKETDPAIVTILGGIYPTLSPEIAMKDGNIDYIVTGEGEERLPSLLRALEAGRGFERIDGLARRVNGKWVHQKERHPIADLNRAPFPDYSLFDMARYTNHSQKFTQNFHFRGFPWAMAITSRGCPYKCTFCASNNVYGTSIRYRSAANVLAEVDMMVRDHGIREMIFVDDSFLQSDERAVAIFEGLIERDYDLVWKSNNMSIFHMTDHVLELMRRSGCYQISVSIESGHPNTLRRIKKPVNLKKIGRTLETMKRLDFEIISNFVIGFPGETWDEIRETFRYAEEIDIDYCLFSIATPLPGTELYEECKAAGLLDEGFSFENFEYYGFGRGCITTEEFTPAELQIARAHEWDRINFGTQEKRIKIAAMLGIDLGELDAWRRETRRGLGVNVASAQGDDFDAGNLAPPAPRLSGALAPDGDRPRPQVGLWT